jgi:hypothetical protein
MGYAPEVFPPDLYMIAPQKNARKSFLARFFRLYSPFRKALTLLEKKYFGKV